MGLDLNLKLQCRKPCLPRDLKRANLIREPS
jgi:hypothetical protein